MKRGGAFYNNCKIYSLINLKQNPTNALISSICGDLTLAGVVRLELTARGFGDRGANISKTVGLRRFRGRFNFEILQYILQ